MLKQLIAPPAAAFAAGWVLVFSMHAAVGRNLPGTVINVPAGGNIAAAVVAAAQAGGGTVNLAAGTYNITASIPMFSNITLNGQGSSTVILAPASPHGFSMIYNVAEGLSNITISNLVLDGNIPRGAFLGGGGGNPYNGAGIYLFAYTYPISPVTISHVEIRNTGIGMLLGTTDNLTVTNSYIHDNNPGGFAHNAYFVACSNVEVDHSRFDNALTGDGLHFDFGASSYLISKSEFSGNNGEGILDEGNTGITIQDSVLNGNANNGIDAYSNNTLKTRLVTDYNYDYGIQQLGGGGTYAYIDAIGNLAGDLLIYGVGGYGTTLTGALTGSTPNVYPAVLANGPTGPADTADWTTAYPGYSTIGEVDFNANHLANGALTFPDVGVVGTGVYSLSVRYSNGSGITLAVPITVNGGYGGVLFFPPTGSWSTWSTLGFQTYFHDGGNSIGFSPLAPAAPEFDTLTVNTTIPSAPATPTGFAATPVTPYQVNLSWTAVAGAASYYITRDGLPIAANALGTSYTDSRILIGGATHTYGIYAQNQGGSSATPATVAVTTPVDTPAGFAGSVASGGNFMEWIAENGATSFNVKRAVSPAGKLVTIANVPATASQDTSNYEQSFTDTTARPGYTYWYAVSSVGGGAESPNSYVLPIGTVGGTQTAADIGTVGVPGSTSYDAATATYTVSGSGLGLAGQADGFQYAYLPAGDDVTMVARVVSVQDVAPGSEAGIDIRSTLAPNAANMLVALTAGQGVQAVARATSNATSAVIGTKPGVTGTTWLRLTRKGATFTAALSTDGMTWRKVASTSINMPRSAYVGLAVSSTVNSGAATALFDTVSITANGHAAALCRQCK